MKVNIIGGAEGWHKAPTEGETWGVNAVPYHLPVTLAFEIHDFDWTVYDCIAHQLREDAGSRDRKMLVERGFNRFLKRKGLRRRLREMDIPVVSKKKYDDIPKSIAFPLEEIKQRFKTDYYTNVIDYTIAYALYTGYDDLHIHAVRMDQEFERERKKPSVTFWMGVAVGTGASVKVYDDNEETRLLRTPTGLIYSYPDIKQEIHIGCL